MEKQKVKIFNYIDFVNESVQTYSWNLISSDKKNWIYEFTDSNGYEYRVENRIKGKVADNEWYVKDKNGNWNVTEVTNAGNIHKIIHTIYGEILPHLMNNNKDINKVTITGVGKTIEKDYVTQRTKVYYRFLKNNLNDKFNIDLIGNKIFVTRK